ncbi:hypothetical protein [Aestuariivirga litoralis]|nr:hypothetical protein [Aestuariivirga litoralis]
MKALSIKTLFAAGALAAALAVIPGTEAHADVDVGLAIYPPVAPLHVGGYGGGYGDGYDGGYEGGYNGGYSGGYYGGWNRPPAPPAYGGWVSCRDGRRILWRSGYRNVEVESCRRGFYRYTAWRNGKQYLMAVDRGGDVSRLRRIY